jgi:hypothetical protein
MHFSLKNIVKTLSNVCELSLVNLINISDNESLIVRTLFELHGSSIISM